MNAFSPISLDDKYVAERGPVYLTGIQALVRLALDQARADRRAGLRTGGFVSGYRGSPLAGFDQQLQAASRHLRALDIHFRPGVNEDLAATAVWGSQKAARHGSDYDGVFGIWYGKAPGVDRCGDVFKHANATGTARHGGVLAVAGDDHAAKSSTLPAQSEFAFMDAEMPVLNPADLQDVLDLGRHGFMLSRFSGLWVGFIALADTMDSSGVVSVDPARLALAWPEAADPRRHAELDRPLLLRGRQELERLTRDLKLPAAQAYVRANRLDRIGFGAPRPRFGLVATGKAFRDLMQTLRLLGIDQARAEAIGLGVYRVAMPWPLEPEGLDEFAAGLERLLVVEHKRPLMEPQIAARLYHGPVRPEIWGKRKPGGETLLPDIGDLGVEEIAPALLAFLPPEAVSPDMRAALDRIRASLAFAREHAADAARSPYFCSGCPHNSSTRIPEGAHAMAGIGCHAMAELAERTTEGLTQMGGEGVPWIGMAPFVKSKHIFANLGDGTYFHSGILAIRQAVAARVPITYKILYNDAVAMTGGQPLDGALDVPRLTRQLAAEGVERIVVLSERPELYAAAALAPGSLIEHRDELLRVEAELAAVPGVTVIVYDQTCAAEKRRRRKKGLYPDPSKRIFINDRVCEACGDCSHESNCLSVEPLPTPFGVKRAINQSSCNKDYSCVKGFCPSFVEVEGGTVRKASAGVDLVALAAGLALPEPRPLRDTFSALVAGIGGTGVTTAAAVLAMAAHLDGLNATTLDVTGLAQKGGPVTSHIRIAPCGHDINGPRTPAAGLDLLLAADLVTAAQADSLALLDPQRTEAVANTHVAPTADFVRHQRPGAEPARLLRSLGRGAREVAAEDFSALAERLLGDAIYANLMMIGHAWQRGLLPLSLEAIENAVRLNGAAVEANIRAFHAGRILAADRDRLPLPKARPAPAPATPDERIDFLARELEAYQDEAYARHFREVIARVREADARAAPRSGLALTRAAAEGLFRLMAYKDEYEVARLYADPEFRRKLEAQFEGGLRLSVLLSPPLLARKDDSGRPRKMRFGPWVFRLFALLARMKRLRGTALDPFGWTAERRQERRSIAEYEAVLGELTARLTPARYGLAVEIARTAERMRGFGFIKEANVAEAAARRDALMARFRAEAPPAEAPAPFLEAAE